MLFVSHNMAAVSALCSKAALFEGGRIAFSGTASDTVAQYLSGIDAAGTSMIWEGPAPGGDEPVQVLRAQVVSDAATRLVTHEPILVELDLELREPVRDLIVAWELSSANGQLLAYTAMDDELPPPGIATAPGRIGLHCNSLRTLWPPARTGCAWTSASTMPGASCRKGSSACSSKLTTSAAWAGAIRTGSTCFARVGSGSSHGGMFGRLSRRSHEPFETGNNNIRLGHFTAVAINSLHAVSWRVASELDVRCSCRLGGAEARHRRSDSGHAGDRRSHA